MIKQKKDHGITLVALIITIIVLLILSAVSINTILSSNFINLATQGTINYTEAQINELQKTEGLDSHLKNVIEKVEEYATSGSGSDSSVPTNPPDTSIIPDPINDIGKYVNYMPESGSYTAASTYSGYSSDQIFSTDEDIKWRIFKVENNTLYLISDRPTQKGGYNNQRYFIFTFI